MNIMYLLGALLMLIILGYAYFIFAISNKQEGATRITGRILSSLIVLILLLLIVFYQTGLAQMPSFMPERPSTRIMRGMSGYVVGMMADDERTIDEFINALRANPELYQKLRERLR